MDSYKSTFNGIFLNSERIRKILSNLDPRSVVKFDANGFESIDKKICKELELLLFEEFKKRAAADDSPVNNIDFYLIYSSFINSSKTIILLLGVKEGWLNFPDLKENLYQIFKPYPTGDWIFSSQI